MTELPKAYDFKAAEERIYRWWEERGYFAPFNDPRKPGFDPGKEPFVISIPPANVTGELHLGHALFVSMEDLMIRYYRMKGDPTLWVPGTDHASIATEIKVVEALKKEGIAKEDLGREKFLERAWAWKREYGGQIVKQLRKLGVSCDWTRERFTMDEGLSRAVRETFVRLYEKGLIYRGARIINWCPTCVTALSDAEVEYEEQDSHLWHIRYPGEFGDIVVATTRPETMLGDTGVCVNPNDARYTHMIGKTVTLPLMNRELPIIADEYADLEFGTGAVKMTPAHDPNDFEVAKRHDLPILRVLNDDGTMNENTGRFAGMTREKCRQEVVKELEALGLLVKIEPLHHNVGTCYRCHQNVEPLVSTQWFVKMKPLAEPAIEVARTKELIFVPERFEKTYLNWMENIRDWCISRQLWWGHRIPAFYCDGCGEVAVSREDISTCPKCGGAVRQDEDVLDTWFSSALWPFSTLGWPEETEDLKYFYPNSVLSCGYDIIFFWLARMVFSGIEQMGQCPFRVALMHGLVRDQQGRKMSKSLGNGIDPIEVIEKYGADALRFSLEMGVSPGSDVRMSEEKIESFRNFVNKIWNASRFVLMNLEGFAPKGVPGEEELALCDKWILAKFQECARAVTDNLENFDLGLAATKLYDFVWSEFCDWYIEMAKQGLNGDDALRKKATQEVLYYVLLGTLKLLHPYIPFVTEEVYGFLPGAEGMLITARWPEVRPEFDFAIAAQQMEGVMEVIRTVRNLRAEMNVTPGRRATLILKPHAGWRGALAAAEGYFKRLAFASGVELLEDGAQNPGKSASAVTGPCELFMPLGELVDVEKELQRLEKDRKNVEGEIARAKGKLENGGFVAKAPAHLIEAEREKMALNGKLLEKLEQRIAEMEALR